MNVLQTERISKASAVQRQGRAGRTAPGMAIRLWSEHEQVGLSDFDKPELLTADLVPAALELAYWGVSETAPGAPGIELPTVPDPSRMQRAAGFLAELGALDPQGRITSKGRRIQTLGLHPRLGRLLDDLRGDQDHGRNASTQLVSAALACIAILAEGDPLRFDGGQRQCDIALRLELWHREATFGSRDRSVWRSVERTAGQLARRFQLSFSSRQSGADSFVEMSLLAATLAAAWPDRIAQKRKGSRLGYRLADGRGVRLGEMDALAGRDYLLVLDMGGSSQEATIALACALDLETIETVCRDRLHTSVLTEWDDERKSVLAITRTTIGELILRQQNIQRPLPAAVAAQAVGTLVDQLVDSAGSWLFWSEAAAKLRLRLQWLHNRKPDDWPDSGSAALFANPTAVIAWLGPDLVGVTSQAELQKVDLGQALRRRLDWEQYQRLGIEAPERIRLSNGVELAVDYRPSQSAGQLGRAVLSTRIQNLFGTARHPCLPDGTRLIVEPLSPAQRPVQFTSDLPGFWEGSYVDVAKELRGRYPKHFWPDDPAGAEPSLSTGKRRPSAS